MGRIASSSRSIIDKLGASYGPSAKAITIKMGYDKEVNDFTRRNREARKKTVNSKIFVR